MKKSLLFALLTSSTITWTMDRFPLKQPVKNWAQQQLKLLSLEEKIGQLFMVATISDPTFKCPGKSNDTFLQHCPYKTDHTYIKKLIQKYHIGGIVFLGYGTPETQKKVTEQFQQLSKKTPLLIGQDCEWGLSMRLDNTVQYPHNMTLGAIQNNDLIYNLGKEIGRQCALLGVHINFAPVVDINTNPKNPIINDRSFGENKKLVTQKALAYMRGLHDAGVLACAKHFPGHGDTATDSHVDLPIIKHDKKRLEKVELHPFKQLIKNGIATIMTAHLAVPALEKNINRPATLSAPIITDLLKKELKFNGLVITDGLGMNGVTKGNAPGSVELNALLAGNDILLCPLNVPKAVTLIKQALTQSKITKQELDNHVLKILLAKQWIVARKKNTDHTIPLLRKLNSQYARALKKLLYQKAVTIVRDEHKIIPLNIKEPIHIILIGTSQKTEFAKTLEQLGKAKIYCIPNKLRKTHIDYLISKLDKIKKVIISLHSMSRFAKENYGITPLNIQLIKTLNKTKSVTLTVFGNPYSLKNVKEIPTVLCAYENDKDAQIATANVLLGNIQAEGKLPVTI